MEYFYNIVKLVAFTVNFCVAIVNLRLMFEAYLTSKMNRLLEEKRLECKSELLLERERWKELHP